MDARNYVCDYNFDWVEKMQKLTNRVWKKNCFFDNEFRGYFCLDYGE